MSNEEKLRALLAEARDRLSLHMETYFAQQGGSMFLTVALIDKIEAALAEPVQDVDGHGPKTGLSGRLESHTVSYNKIETYVFRWKPRVWIWWTRDLTAEDECLFLAQGETKTEAAARRQAIRSHAWHVARKEELEGHP